MPTFRAQSHHFLWSWLVPRGSVAFLLEVGVITWSHIKWSPQATAHVPSSVFARALNVMEHAWDGLDTSMAKLSVNNMIGLFAREVSQTTFSVRSSKAEVDGAGHSFRSFSLLATPSTYGFSSCAPKSCKTRPTDPFTTILWDTST